MEIYQTIILELDDLPEDDYTNQLNDNGSLWVITQHNYKNNCDMMPYNIISYYKEKGLSLRNIIIWYVANDSEENFMSSRYRYILLFSKEKEFYFDKDPIREKHKWAHLDWGKRAKRYHPLGKDPGNSWIREVDDGKANTIEHKPLTKNEILERIILCSSQVNDNVLIFTDKEFQYEKRNVKTIIRNPVNLFYTVHKKSDTNILNTLDYKEVSYLINYQSSENMNTTEDKTIQTIVTSPPYWDLKNYKNHDKQIGYKEGYKDYHDRLNLVWKECYRVLKDDGNMFVNVNTLTKNKEMVLIQEDIIRHMQSIGFILKDIIMWNKPSGIPNKYGLSDRYEYIMWFVKNIDSHKVYNVELPRDYLVKDIHSNGNMWLMFRKAGNIAKKLDHPAIYPNQLVERCVLLTTKQGDTVLDPFLGSGTSLIATMNLGRSFIGFEINKNYEEVIQHRIKNELNDNEKK